ncbi:MAG: tetratricopeptide repeat protein [Gemmatimonadetes bacterium]|nr:tetratricopeptide repeat protein [Gemmatimonadota bacterium]
MAQRRRTTTPTTASTSPLDTFAAGILRFVGWARERAQVVVAAGVVAVLLVAALVYYALQRSRQLDLAAAELETVQVAALTPGPQAQDEIRAYIDRFSGTPYAIEAYLLLGDIYLRQDQAEAAIAALQEIAPSYASPLHVQVTFLLAVAYEQAERWDDAATLYQELLDRAEFPFEKREAGEGLARAELGRGNPTGAIAAYEDILAALDPDDPERGAFEMHLSEVRAQNP